MPGQNHRYDWKVADAVNARADGAGANWMTIIRAVRRSPRWKKHNGTELRYGKIQIERRMLDDARLYWCNDRRSSWS